MTCTTTGYVFFGNTFLSVMSTTMSVEIKYASALITNEEEFTKTSRFNWLIASRNVLQLVVLHNG
jgi:hypothetical protein